MSDRDRWKRVSRLFHLAKSMPRDQRERVLAASGESADIVADVRELLETDEELEVEGGFLDAPPPAAPASEGPLLAPGSMVGFYRINGVAGRGGMGVVYDAEDTKLRRRVALKSLPPGIAGDDRQRQRLQQEAQAAAALQHPGIAVVYALEEFDGHLFIATEYLEGETLRVEIERGRQPSARALATAAEITRALLVAHQSKIVHRDLKPENIMRTRSGALKILDFGLAQFDDTSPDRQSITRITKQGLVAGTPGYMPPEQLCGEPSDFRVDQFALGVILYEMCTAAHPFGGTTMNSVVRRILTAEPTPPSAADVPPAAWAVIERCLQKDAANRFESTSDLLQAILEARERPASALSEVRRDQPAADRTPDGGATHERDAPTSSRTASHPAAPALSWWRIHQLATTVVYSLMVWPAWMVHRSLGPWGLAWFFSILAAVVVAGILRPHLWFSSRVYPEDLQERRAEVSRLIWCADAAFAALLVIGGIALPADKAGWAALLISVGLGAAISFLIIEPATARAAFRKRDDDR